VTRSFGKNYFKEDQDYCMVLEIEKGQRSKNINQKQEKMDA
jgi:hypothetical protein